MSSFFTRLTAFRTVFGRDLRHALPLFYDLSTATK